MNPNGPRSLLMRTLTARAIALLLTVSALAACDRGREPVTGGIKTITSTDGALQFQVPSSWSQQSDLNEVAALQAGDRISEAYAVVIADPRKPFASMDLAKFADQQMQQLVTRVRLANLTGPEQVTVNGKDALQYQLKGFHNSVEVVYLYTFVETEDRFLKVISWSLASNFDKNKDALEQVSASIRELKPLEETPASSGDAPPDPAQIPAPQDPATIDRGVEPEG